LSRIRSPVMKLLDGGESRLFRTAENHEARGLAPPSSRLFKVQSRFARVSMRLR
jgi:hypothetical protein